MDLVNADNEVVVVDDEDLMVADDERCFVFPIASMMQVSIHQ